MSLKKPSKLNLIMFDDMGSFWPLPENLGAITILGKPLVYYVVKKIIERGINSITLIFRGTKAKIDILDKIDGLDVEYEVIQDISEIDELEGIFLRGYDIFVVESLKEIEPLVDMEGVRRVWTSHDKLTRKENVEKLHYPWHFLSLMEKLLSTISETKIHPDAYIDENVLIRGKVIIEKGTKIFGNSVIVGPTYIGKNTLIGNCSIVRSSSIEDGALIGARMEVARSLFLSNSETHSGYIGDSILSYHTHTGAEFVTANLRLDRGLIQVKMGEKRILTERNKLGAIIGEHTEIAVNVSTMPGVLIGKYSYIGPNTVVFENVPDKTKYYARFNIISKPI